VPALIQTAGSALRLFGMTVGAARGVTSPGMMGKGSVNLVEMCGIVMCSKCRAADLNIVRCGQSIPFPSWTVPSYVVTTMFCRSTILPFASQEVLPAGVRPRKKKSNPRNMMSRGRTENTAGYVRRFAKGTTQNPAYNILTTFTL
jgi:hypothetical protein